MTIVIRVNEVNPDPRVIELGGRMLREGYLVAFPTETVYGLGANAFNFQAVVKVFKAKNRPLSNPLIVHLYSDEQLKYVVSEVPDEAIKLMKKFWPGPLTIVLPKSRDLPSVVTGGLDKVGVRIPAHPVSLKLLRSCGVPVVASSANRSGSVSPLTADDVIDELRNYVDLVLDGGETYLGIESTVLDLTIEPPTILRLGSLPKEEIEKVLGTEVRIPLEVKGVRKGELPYSKYRHYDIGKYLVLVEASDYDDLQQVTEQVKEVAKELGRKGKVAILATEETLKYYEDLRKLGYEVINLGTRKEPYVIGKSLFKILRTLSKLRVDYVVAEGIEERGLGSAIMSRLRAASTKIVKV